MILEPGLHRAAREATAMAGMVAKPGSTIAAAFLAGALALFAGGESALAQAALTGDQILEALRPRVPRSLTTSPAERARVEEEQRVIGGALHQSPSGTLSPGQRGQVAAVTKEKPKVDLEIYFDYKSTAISAKAAPELSALGKALKDPELAGSRFMIAGHTDAKGSDQYNLSLSERRAEAVKRYLVERFGLSADTLMAVGYGKEQLKDKDNPYSAKNRRVQVVNFGAKSTASK